MKIFRKRSRSEAARTAKPASPSTSAEPTESSPESADQKDSLDLEAPANIGSDRPAGMVWIPPGKCLLGSDQHYPEEGPAGWAELEGFWLDQTTVTNRQFREFILASGYRTVAERSPDPKMYPNADPILLVPGSIVFKKAARPISLADPNAWWSWTPGACWNHPTGPGSTIDNLDDHPVVQVCYSDATAYAIWAEKRLPSEAEWEHAARAGHQGWEFIWPGDELLPDGQRVSNHFHGEFPWKYKPLSPDHRQPSPVRARSFEPNDWGLYQMAGNVWEWTESWYLDHQINLSGKSCCAPHPQLDPSVEASLDPEHGIPRKVLKGGSFLCAENYCRRYRPAARIPETIESATNHISFRCAR